MWPCAVLHAWATAGCTLAAIGQRGLGLVRGIALAALMPMDEYGLLGVAILVANLLMPACSAGLYDGVARYAPHHESTGTLPRFVARAGGLALAIALITTVLLFVFADQ